MKKIIALFLVLTMLLALGACGKKETPAAEPEKTTAAAEVTEAPAPETTVPAETEPQPAPLYGEILDSYFDALLQGKGPEEYTAAGLNYLPGMVKDIEKIGYCLDDIDGNGIPELLIGAVGEAEIYALYTMVNGEETMVIDAGERNVYWMDSDGMIINRGSNSAASSGYMLYRFDGTGLIFQDALIFDSEANQENPWFYAMDEDWDVSNDAPIDSEEAEQIVEQLEDSKMMPGYVSFIEYNK